MSERNITESIIAQFCEKNNISFSEKNLSDFSLLTKLLLEFNEHTNLTALKTETDIAEKHYADSLFPLKYPLIPENAKVIDVGCGAGFPGLPLKIMRDDLMLTFLDSTEKKLKFTKSAADALGFSVECVAKRAEEVSRELKFREAFDVAVSRAVANLPVLLELCMPFVKVGGIFIAYKMEKATENAPDSELSLSKKAIPALGGELSDILNAPLTGSEIKNGEELKHVLIVIKKTKKLSTNFPRRYPQIIKNPL